MQMHYMQVLARRRSVSQVLTTTKAIPQFAWAQHLDPSLDHPYSHLLLNGEVVIALASLYFHNLMTFPRL